MEVQVHEILNEAYSQIGRLSVEKALIEKRAFFTAEDEPPEPTPGG